MTSSKWAAFSGGVVVLCGGLSIGAQQRPPSTTGTTYNLESGLRAARAAGSTSAASSIDEKSIRDDVDRIVSDAFNSRKLRSVVVGVVSGGKDVFEKAYGDDPLFASSKNDKSIPFALGPASEILTGYGALELVADGKMSLEDPASKYVPTLPEAWRAVTIGQLMAHTSGLPNFPPDAKSFARALEQLGNAPLMFPPGKARRRNYSDYDVLGQAMQSASKQPYVKFTNDSVFKKLKMNTSGDLSILVFRRSMSSSEAVIGLAGQSRSTNLTTGDTASGRNDSEVIINALNSLKQLIPDYAVPSEGLGASMEDVLKLYTTLISDSLPGIPAKVGYSELAPGWNVCHSGDDVLWMTYGLSPGGYGVMMDLLPKRKSGWVLQWMLRQGSDTTLPAEERSEILERAFGVKVRDWTCGPQGKEEDDDDNS